MNQGFIITRNWRDTAAGIELELWLSTDSGPKQLIVPGQQAVFFLPAAEREPLQALAGRYSFECRELELRDFSAEPVLACYFNSQRNLREVRELLRAKNIFPMEADLNPAERYLMERFIRGGLAYIELPELRCSSADYQPSLRMASVDIETAMEGVQLYSIGIYAEENGQAFEKVMMLGSDSELPFVECYASERALLMAFLNWLEEYDPDVLIGWNVINFDLWFLQRLADKLKMPLTMGRGQRRVHWRELDDDGERRTAHIPGRVALDGIEMLRIATYRFESFSLESVSRELLGDGKLLHGGDRGRQITELFETDQASLARYNLQDCELVWRIFEKTELLQFCIARSQMTGLNLDRLGGSVAAFDFLYLPRLHRQGYVAPNASTEAPGSPGGFVMDSLPGIYDHVLVLDFKSLYPSIIRTFRVDPLGLAMGLLDNEPDTVPGFDGGRFDRQQHLLPAIIEALWEQRDQAKRRKDGAQSQAIKIIMNSFYGVLGTPGCRFFDGRLASSITRRGHQIIQETRDEIERLGERVIYGDTDSVFVWVQGAEDDEAARLRGKQLQDALNSWWQQRLRDEFDLDSVLELEFETHFRRF